MKDLLYLFLDFLFYGVQSVMLVSLLQELLQKRFRKYSNRMTGLLFGLQYWAIQIFLADAPIVKKVLYGEDMMMRSSGQSIWMLFLSMFLAVGAALLFYRGNGLGAVYLVTTFYAFRELVRFTLYTFLAWLLTFLINNSYGLWEQGFIEIWEYTKLLDTIQVVWNLIVMVSTIVILALCLRKYLSWLKIPDYRIRHTELGVLVIPSVMGLVLAVMLRSILFRFEGNEMHLLLTDHPQMNVIIPCMTFLGILSILFSIKIFGKMVEEKEARWKAELYKSRLSDMEEHLTQVEQLYDGIRGMKHDMKHYIADMEALLYTESESETKEAFRRYLTSLEGAVERLDIRYQTGNPVTDVVLGRYIQMAKEQGICLELEFLYPQKLAVEAFDLGIILNNGMENAIEACVKVEQEKRFIRLKSYQKENMFFLTIENSFDGILQKTADTGLLSTSKDETKGHGYGLKNIKSCAEKYYGTAEINVKENVFQMTVMLQGGK